jgi:hypothetical protein
MAAFVGNHHCVSVINNHVPREDVVYYTRKQPFEEQPKLAAELCKPLHDLVMSMNTSPVRIALHFRANPKLLQSITSIRKVSEIPVMHRDSCIILAGLGADVGQGV